MIETTPPESLQGKHPSSATMAVERIDLFENLRRREAHQPGVEVVAEVLR